MAREIERKFLVNDSIQAEIAKTESINKSEIIQGYLARSDGLVVRVRTVEKILSTGRQERAFLTIKSNNPGRVRDEYEYEIPYNDGVSMLFMCNNVVLFKTRYLIQHENDSWEVDVYHDKLNQLITAELELKTSDQEIDLPAWISREVTDEPLFSNYHLASYGLPYEFNKYSYQKF